MKRPRLTRGAVPVLSSGELVARGALLLVGIDDQLLNSEPNRLGDLEVPAARQLFERIGLLDRQPHADGTCPTRSARPLALCHSQLAIKRTPVDQRPSIV